MADTPKGSPIREAAGMVLIATPLIGDPNFERAVVYVIEHAEPGALGIVLNRPSNTELLGPLPEWDRFAAHPSVVFVGGPVEPERAIALARTRPGPAGSGSAPALDHDVFQPLLGAVGTLDLSSDPDRVGAGIDAVRVFSGYAGWGPGQLEAELEAGAWWPVASRSEDLLSDRPEQLWEAILARQPGELALFARYPEDPSLN